jgi:acyl carrier protein
MTDRNTVEERIQLLLEDIALQGFEVLASSTWEDMGIDSLSKVEFCMDLEDEFNVDIPDEVMEILDTVEEITEYISRRLGLENE